MVSATGLVALKDPLPSPRSTACIMVPFHFSAYLACQHHLDLMSTLHFENDVSRGFCDLLSTHWLLAGSSPTKCSEFCPGPSVLVCGGLVHFWDFKHSLPISSCIWNITSSSHLSPEFPTLCPPEVPQPSLTQCVENVFISCPGDLLLAFVPDSS